MGQFFDDFSMRKVSKTLCKITKNCPKIMNTLTCSPNPSLLLRETMVSSNLLLDSNFAGMIWHISHRKRKNWNISTRNYSIHTNHTDFSLHGQWHRCQHLYVSPQCELWDQLRFHRNQYIYTFFDLLECKWSSMNAIFSYIGWARVQVVGFGLSLLTGPGNF